jgi:hypothetical protein
MATTYSSDLGIKLIGTGLEAGTWGQSTSQNLKRLEAAIGLAVTLDVTAMPGVIGNSSLGGATPSDATWLLTENADSDGAAGDPGGQGRASAVEFNDDGAPISAGDQTVLIRGNASGSNANRTYVVWNNLSADTDLILDCASGLYTVRNGAFALVNCNPDGTGGWGNGAGAGVANLLSNVQVEGLTLSGAGTIDAALGDLEVLLLATSATAFTVNDGTTDLLAVDALVSKLTLDSDTATRANDDTEIDFTGAGQDKNGLLRIKTTSTEALNIENDAEKRYISIDTTLDRVSVGEADPETRVDLDVFGDISVADAATNITVKDETPSALTVKDEAAVEYFGISPATAIPTNSIVSSGVSFHTPDIVLTGSDGYISGTTLADTTLPEDGYGIRNNSGIMEFKNIAGAWQPILASISGGGAGSYFESTAITMSSLSATSPQAHGILVGGVAAIPSLITISYRCIVSNNGYLVDEEVSNNDINGDMDSWYGVQAWSDDTDCGAIIGSVITMVHKTSFLQVAMSKADWRMYIRAWA